MATVALSAGSACAPHAGPGGQPLRLAVFADRPEQPQWLVDALGEATAGGVAEIVLVVAAEQRDVQPTMAQDSQPHLPTFTQPPTRLSWAWRAYLWADRRLFGRGPDPSRPVALSTLAPRAPHLTEQHWASEVARLGPIDVVVALGHVDDAPLENIARYGVWRYCFGQAHDTGEGQAGLEEVAEGQPVTVSGLRVRLWPGTSRLIYRSASRTNPFSVARNRDNLLAKTRHFLARELAQLHRLGQARLQAPGESLAPAPVAASLGGAWLGLGRILGRLARRGLEKLCYIEQWSIAFRSGPAIAEGGLAGYTPLVPPADRIWADPFPLHRQGRHYIFFEEVPFATGRGYIAVTEILPDGSHTAPKEVLREDYHLSYPFLIEDGDELFMVPESGQNHSVDLYRCTRFPDHWEKVATLLSGVDCADATFHHNEDGWWMFVNIGAPGSELYDELHLYHAAQLSGPWLPHPANPVKSDVRCARPAGRLFLRHGILHRPAQICAPRYGTGIAIARVVELDRETYREEIVEEILPPAGGPILGIHTMNHAGALDVIDCFARRRRL